MNDVKRYIALFSILVVFTTMLAGCNVNRMGKDQYYVQITADGLEKNEKADNDTPIKLFEYKLSGFDEGGKEKTMEFTAPKNLRKEAFLRVYYSDKKGVTSWEEVKKDDIPSKAKEKLGVK